MSFVIAAFLVAGPVAAAGPGQKAPLPTEKQRQDLVEAYFAQDGAKQKGRFEQFQIARKLDEVPALAPAEAKKWTAAILKATAKGPLLERKNGRHFLWTKPEEKGLYIVGGESKQPKGLIVAMHGGGKGSGDAWSAHGPYDSAADKLGWLLICPEVIEKTERGWTDSGTEEFVVALIEAALRTWKIDRDKVYLSGHSMGGYGTWTLGAHHADRVAALAASAGAPTPVFGPGGAVVDIEVGIIPNLRNVPMVVYQSDDDPNVPPAANRAAAAKLAEAQARWGGFVHEYWEVPGRGHDLPPGGVPALLGKVKDRARDPRPTRVVWQPALEWKRQFYWLWWEEPVRGALVVADCDREKNEIAVECDAEPKGLEVLLDEHLVDLEKDVVVKLGGKEIFRGRPERRLSTLVRTGATGDPGLVFAASVKLAP